MPSSVHNGQTHRHGCLRHHAHNANESAQTSSASNTSNSHTVGDCASSPAVAHLTKDTITCSHHHHSGKKAKQFSLDEIISKNVVVRSFQAATGLLMIPMAPLFIYEVYESVSKAFDKQSELPA